MAAAIADPIVEFASNAGWFGPGNFTDRSNLDVFPALAAGLLLLVLYLVRAAPALLAGEIRSSGIVARLPLIFATQIAVLFAMESAEQLAVHGAILGPTIWLGGPLFISLGFHAAVCVALTSWLSRSSPRLAATALRVIALIKAIGTLAAHAPGAPAPQRFGERCVARRAPVVGPAGERAPPLLQSLQLELLGEFACFQNHGAALRS